MIEGLSVTLTHYLIVGAVIFGFGTVIALSKRWASAAAMPPLPHRRGQARA